MIRQNNNPVARMPAFVVQSQPQADELDALELAFLGSLLPGIIHNLATPLSGVLGATQLLEHRSEAIQEIVTRGSAAGTNELLAQLERNRTNVDILSRNAQHLADILKTLVERVNRGVGSARAHVLLNELMQSELRFLDANLHFKHRVNKQLSFYPETIVVDCVFGHVAAALDEFVSVVVAHHDVAGGSMTMSFTTAIESNIACIHIGAQIPRLNETAVDSSLLQLYLARLEEEAWKTALRDEQNSLSLTLQRPAIST